MIAARTNGNAGSRFRGDVMGLDSATLIKKLNKTCVDSLQAAAGLCVSRTNYNVEIEHWLLKLVEVPGGDLARILPALEVNTSNLIRDLTRTIDGLQTGNARTPSLSVSIDKAIREAWLIASIQFGASTIRSGTLLLGMLSDETLGRQLKGASKELAALSTERIVANFAKVTAGSTEDDSATTSAPSGDPSAQGTTPGGASRTPALDKYTVNLTAKAKQGKIDPVVGRESEVRQMVDILIRRRQNNPILTGEAGVGKTAVVEGFARRIAEGDVPPALKDVAVHTLDLGLLQAGAGVKGEFENRLKSVIEEVKASPIPIIMFIDEAHTMIGAGGTAGQIDAANLLKPALARGELRTIAATTWAEYKKYFEKDAALARRFQVVKVEEPDEQRAVRMMRGITGMLELHHKVRILDEAIEASVKLSARYIPGRQLPDKSVSLLDTACARVAIAQNAVPPSIEDLRREISHLELEIQILERESVTGARHEERAAETTEKLEKAKVRLVELEKRWEQERTLVNAIRDLREKIEAAHADSKSGKPADPEAPSSDTLQKELEAKTVELRAMQGETPLMQVCVDGQTVAEVVAGWTGIPVGKMMTDEMKTVLELESKLAERVIGQPQALEAVGQRIRTARANLTDPRRPIGVFLFVGPSGVGKTETALALAESLYGGERNLISINMSEYQEAHTVSSLKGSPPGYVGYGEGGVLTEAVRRKPYSVVLLDEVEKAHPDVMELFFQVFDKGILEDGEGREIDFKNTVILLTSNVGTDTAMKLCADPDTRPDAPVLAESLRADLLKVFPPALLGRMIVVPYYPITDDVMRQIIRLQLDRIAARMLQNHKARMEYADDLIAGIAGRCKEVDSGARNVDHILTRSLLPDLSHAMLTRMSQGQTTSRVRVNLKGDGAFDYVIE